MRVLKVAIYLEHLKKCGYVQKCEKYYVSVVFFGVLILWCLRLSVILSFFKGTRGKRQNMLEDNASLFLAKHVY